MESCETILAKEIYDLAKKIYPLQRSITGNPVRETLKILSDYISSTGSELNVYEIPTGTKVFDWIIPQEWRVTDAYLKDAEGTIVASYNDNCLHVMGYSAPIDAIMELEELQTVIHTQTDQPDVIPYVTSYYSKQPGFCMSEKQFRELKPGKYHIKIESEFYDGSLTYADLLIKGKTDDEILISTYSCHPSMANDNCSGLALAAGLAKYLFGVKDRRYTYRFVFAPETIGVIAYLSQNSNLEYMRQHVKAGFVLSCVGDNGNYSMIQSPSGDSLSDKVLSSILNSLDVDSDRIKIHSFLDRGSDERQYNAPGVELGVVGFCRTKYWDFPEYHTSDDTMEFVSCEGFLGSFSVMKKVIETIEYNDSYVTTVPCEPQLGKRGLYPNVSQKNTYDEVAPMLNFLAYANGKRDLLEISEIIHCSVDRLIPIIDKLILNGLIARKGEVNNENSDF